MANFKAYAVNSILALSLVSLYWCFTLYYAASVDHTRKVYIIKNTEYTTNYNFFESNLPQKGSPQNDRNITEDVIAGNSVRKSKAKQNTPLATKYAKKRFAMTHVQKDTSQFDGKMGYILVTLYAEQQIGAAMNMFSLQKWAKTVNASVVEPFVVDSQFKLPYSYPIKNLNNKLRFRDYFNIQIWNELSVANNATPLTSWSDFLNRKPKTFIFVAIINAYKNVINPVHINDDIMNQFECKDTFDWFTHKLKDYKDLLQAKMVRRVCLSFFNTRMNISDFTQYIYGDIDPTDTIVWFQIWKGFAYNNRVRVIQQYFHRTREILPMVRSSDRIVTDAQNYVRRYLGTEFGEYVGISIRSVVRAKYLTPPGEEHMYTFFRDCFKNLGETIQSLNTTSKKVFMSLDLGRFGDKTQTLFISPPMIRSIEDMLFQTVYNGSVKMQEWESSFIDSTNGITDSGYIAAVQRTILDNSKCLIMFGGRSNFQRSIEVEFKDKYGNNSCIHDVCYTQ
ncbi:uncharacterized protein [Dysidea avara]|uniref:uncharacterized protein n=1 Tax=Dysidea avara TaxID=196820 RepID=UPI0033190023